MTGKRTKLVAQFFLWMTKIGINLIFMKSISFFWCRILTERMFLLANSRGRFFWLWTWLQNGIEKSFGYLSLSWTFVIYLSNWILRKASVEVWDACELIKNICLYISGLTSSNYSELSHLYEKYKTQGMLHLGKFLLILFNNSFFSTKMCIRLNLYILKSFG